MRTQAKRWWPSILSVIVMVLCFATAIIFVLLVPTINRVTMQAHQGQQAKAHQCALYPITLRGEQYLAAHGAITAKQLETYQANKPNCK